MKTVKHDDFNFRLMFNSNLEIELQSDDNGETFNGLFEFLPAPMDEMDIDNMIAVLTAIKRLQKYSGMITYLEDDYFMVKISKRIMEAIIEEAIADENYIESPVCKA